MPRARSPPGEKSQGLGTTGLCDPAHPCSHALGAQLPASPSIASAFAFDGAVVGTPLQRPLRNLSDTMRVCLLLSRVQLFATPWTVARQAPLSMGFSRQEYWSGLPFPPPGDLPDPEMTPAFPVTPATAGGFFTTAPSE